MLPYIVVKYLPYKINYYQKTHYLSKLPKYNAIFKELAKPRTVANEVKTPGIVASALSFSAQPLAPRTNKNLHGLGYYGQSKGNQLLQIGTKHTTAQFNIAILDATIKNYKDSILAIIQKGLSINWQNQVQDQSDKWQVIKTKNGDSLTKIFKRLKLTEQTLQNILKDNGEVQNVHIKPEQELQFVIKKNILNKMIVPLSTTKSLLIYNIGQQYKNEIGDEIQKIPEISAKNISIIATIHGSIYNTAKRNNIPYQIVQQMVKVFSTEINFARNVHSGDQIVIIYKAFYNNNKLIKIGNILALSYKNRDKIYRAILNVSRNGVREYFSPEGLSFKKAFNRYPVKFSHISSAFRWSRQHPILHYKRAHKGVDLAAPLGTPIYATGAGHIIMIGRQSGYGNMIQINHNKIYSTIYGHMLRFKKGLARGDYVKKGQIIGFVGQSGLATGPHCHYEFHVNKQPKNPTTVDLPRQFPMPAKELAIFKSKANILLAQLKSFENIMVARK